PRPSRPPPPANPPSSMTPRSPAGTATLHSRDQASAGCDATPPPRSPTERRERADRRDPAPPHGRARQDRSPPPPARPAGPLPRHRWSDAGDHLPGCTGDRGGGSARRQAAASPRLLLQRSASDGGVRDGEVRRLAEVGRRKQG